jgi:hypothetical protein
MISGMALLLLWSIKEELGGLHSSAQQRSPNIRTPILRKNRKHEPVHYTQLRQTVEEKTGKKVSIRTIRRYGKEKLGARDKRTQKRTHEESQCTQHIQMVEESPLSICTTLTNYCAVFVCFGSVSFFVS